MAQRPTADFNIDPNVTSGTDLANILNRFQDAIDSGNSGASRPAYLDAGGLWVREGDPMRLYLYDGTTDRELYNTTDGLVGASQWKDNGDDIYYSDGNVGIGTSGPEAPLSVTKNNTVGVANNASAVFQASESSGVDAKLVLGVRSGSRPYIHAVDGDTKTADSLDFGVRGNSFAMRINSSGNVGIGMNPLRQASEAKEQLEDWKSAIEERMKAEPKADRSAVTQEITGFEELPTLEQVKERLERAAGDKLQVNGNASVKGRLLAGRDDSQYIQLWGDPAANRLSALSGAGNDKPFVIEQTADGNLQLMTETQNEILLRTNSTTRLSIDGTTGDATFSGKVGIGMSPLRQASEAKEQLEDWKSAIEERMKAEPKADRSAVTQEITGFEELPTLEQVKERLERAAGDKLQVDGNIRASSTVRAEGGLETWFWKNPTDDIGLILTGNEFYVVNSDNSAIKSGVLSLGSSGHRWKDAYFSGTVDAAGFTVNGSPLLRVSDLIETLSTLRNATKDEETLEGLRDAIGDAVGGLIQKFEAIQAEAEKAATMDISE